MNAIHFMNVFQQSHARDSNITLTTTIRSARRGRLKTYRHYPSQITRGSYQRHASRQLPTSLPNALGKPCYPRDSCIDSAYIAACVDAQIRDHIRETANHIQNCNIQATPYFQRLWPGVITALEKEGLVHTLSSLPSSAALSLLDSPVSIGYNPFGQRIWFVLPIKYDASVAINTLARSKIN